jgi:hypothetical protein
VPVRAERIGGESKDDAYDENKEEQGAGSREDDLEGILHSLSGADVY